jgi:hypothetical protein
MERLAPEPSREFVLSYEDMMSRPSGTNITSFKKWNTTTIKYVNKNKHSYQPKCLYSERCKPGVERVTISSNRSGLFKAPTGKEKKGLQLSQ